MRYIGLDVHQNCTSLCVLGEDGKVQTQKTVKARWPAVIEEIKSIPGPFAVCYEASTGYGWWHERLTPLATHVAVAHPGHLRLIFRAKKKHDRIDARKLAKLLYLGEVPQVHVPNVDVRQWRKLIEFRQRLLGRRVALKNQIRAILKAQALEAPRGLWTKKGLAWLKTLDLPSGEQLALDLGLDEIEGQALRIKRVEDELAKIASSHPGVTLLMTVPGIGIRTAEALCAYIDDVRRFTRTKQVGSYFGLVPCLDSSAGKDRFGHITRDGPSTVRKLLTEAAWQGVRRSPRLKAFFERIAKNDPDRKKIALIATANHLCRVTAAMLRGGEAWRETEDKNV